MGRQRIVPRDQFVACIRKHSSECFLNDTTSDIHPVTHEIWSEIAKDLNFQIKPVSIFLHVKHNRDNIMETLGRYVKPNDQSHMEAMYDNLSHNMDESDGALMNNEHSDVEYHPHMEAMCDIVGDNMDETDGNLISNNHSDIEYIQLKFSPTSDQLQMRPVEQVCGKKRSKLRTKLSKQEATVRKQFAQCPVKQVSGKRRNKLRTNLSAQGAREQFAQYEDAENQEIKKLRKALKDAEDTILDLAHQNTKMRKKLNEYEAQLGMTEHNEDSTQFY